MPINTDLNSAPYFDDFSADKHFHKILFRPHMAVQARELTQLQTILQDQIEMFGDNILREGTIISGGNFTEEPSLSFVKLKDKDPSTGLQVIPSAYVGYTVRGTSTGLTAVILAAENGLETKAPDLNTIWVKYLNTTQLVINNVSVDVKVFRDGESLEILSPAGNLVATTVATQMTENNFGYGVYCGEGIIYQKGHFIRFDNALTVVEKYHTKPDSKVVGFQTIESIVDSYQDSSLLDNANSFNNYNAPGANRLKLTSVLVVKTIAEGQADETFFAIQEYSRGNVVRRKLDTVYNKLGDMIARRTSEESGDYVVSGFDLDIDYSTKDPDNLSIIVSPGVGYVQGYRVETSGNIAVDVSKGLNDSTYFSSENNQMIFANYGNYVVVDNMIGVFEFKSADIVELKDAGGVVVGTARVKAVTNHTVSQQHRIYLFDISLTSGKSFGDVDTLEHTVTLAAASLVSSGLVDSSTKTSVYPVGRSSLKSIDYVETGYVYRDSFIFTVNNNDTIVITPTNTADVLPYAANDILNSDQLRDFVLIDGTGTPVNLTGAVATVDGTSKNITITLAAPIASLTVTAFFNVYKTNVAPTKKFLQRRTVNLAISSTNLSGPYCLGMPDVYKIVSVKVNGVDATSNFVLDTNQKDNFYGLSFVSPKTQLAANDLVEVVVDAFTVTVTGNVNHSFFTIDSYPVDDSIAVLPSNLIRTQDIPTFTSSTNASYYLRDCFDFRPYPKTTWVSGVVNPSSVLDFDTNAYTPMSPSSAITTSYEYYLGRYDKLIIDQYGQFSIIEGTPAEVPIRPADIQKTLTLGVFFIPPYPAMPSWDANKKGMPQYGVRFSKNNNRRYTMSDIRGFDQRITNIEYYTSLSLMETQTKDMLVLDENGNNRFKNGIFVDTFENLSIADTTSSEFAAGIDLSEKSIHPSFKTFPLDLTVKQLNSATDHGGVVSLQSEDKTIIDQPYVTSFKNCTTGLYNFAGETFMFPDTDSGVDVINAPDVTINIDLSKAFADFTEGLSNFIPLQRVDTSATPETRTTLTAAEKSALESQGITGVNFQRTSTVTTKTTGFTTSAGAVEVSEIGDFVTDVAVSPYLRSKEVKLFISGLRPNTRFWPYFDQKSVSVHCAPAFYNSSVTGSINPGLIVKNGNYGDVLRSNSKGELYFTFLIPEATFRVGDRVLEVFDVSTYSSKDALTSYSSKVYSGFNYSITKTGLAQSTKNIETNVTTSTKTVQNIRYTHDPLIQSFIIDEESTDDSFSIISSVDLFFGTKSSDVGVSVMIKEMENGIPTPRIVPYSKVHLKTSDINVSETGVVSTTVKFESPLPLRTNVEYGLCIFPDGGNPDFKVAISRTGEKDLNTGVVVSHDTNAGMIFTSTNNRTWTPYQNENLKFKLNSLNFTSATGSVVLEPSKMEFINLDKVVGSFIPGEKIIVKKTVFEPGTVTIVQGNPIVSGSGTNFNTMNGGDWFVASDAGTPYLMKVSSGGVASATNVNCEVVPIDSKSNLSWYKTVVGDVSLFDINDKKLVIKDSSATFNNTFTSGTTVVLYGMQSKATATGVTLISQPISYLQPNIRRVESVNTRTKLFADLISNNGTSSGSLFVPYNNNTYLKDVPSYIPSYSDVLNGTNNVSFTVLMNSNITTLPINTSPLVDYGISTVFAYTFAVNNDSTGENTNLGNSKAKYVSKVVELADGMDADDLRVYVTGYKPTSCDIKVYGKFLSSADGRSVAETGWTELKLKPESNANSSNANRLDFKEFEYIISSDATANADTARVINGVFSYTDTSGAVYNNYKRFALKIVMLSSDHSKVPRIKDVRAISLS